MPLPELAQMRAAATEIADIIRLSNQDGYEVETKADQSLVTSIDKMANEMLRKWSEQFAVDFIGEEGNDEIIGHDHIIYVDPLDGTSTYIAGKAEVSVVITLMKKTDYGWIPQAAVIHEALTGRSWSTWASSGVHYSDHPAQKTRRLPRISPVSGKAHVSVITWRDVPFNLGEIRNRIEIYPNMHHHGCGNTSINGGLIASGRMHASLYGGPSAVETAAMTLMVKEAGGVATNLFGNPLSGFELKLDSTGKLDFALTHGAIMASDQALANTLTEIVQQAQ